MFALSQTNNVSHLDSSEPLLAANNAKMPAVVRHNKGDLGALFVDEECVRDAERPILRLRKQPDHVGVSFHIPIDGSVVKVIADVKEAGIAPR